MNHEVFLADRGGKEPFVRKLDGLIRVKWFRVRDDVSECEIDLRGMSQDCRNALAIPGLEMRYEIVVFRNGQRVWEGTITRRHLSGGAGKLYCRDVLLFTQRTVCKQKWSSAFADGGPERVTKRVERVLRAEMQPFDAAGANLLPGLVVRTNSETSKTSRVAARFSQYVWDDMEELAARGGLDYTVANRSIYLFDTHQFLGMGRQLTDADFLAELEVVGYGLELAVGSFVTDGMGHASSATSDDDYYGPFELLASAYNANTTTERIPTSELTDQAKRNARSRYPVPVVLRVPENAQVRPDAVDSLMPYLIPGTGFPLYSKSSGLEVSSVQKLDRVTVEEDTKGERVAITLSAAPIGSGLEEVDG